MEGVVRQRPLGITIIAIILAVIAILSLIAIILGFVGVAAFIHSGVLSAFVSIALIIGAIIAIAELAVAWGLWTLKAWAFWVTVIVEVIHVLNALFSWLVAHNSLGSSLVSLIVGLVILIYLFADPNVRAAFRT